MRNLEKGLTVNDWPHDYRRASYARAIGARVSDYSHPMNTKVNPFTRIHKAKRLSFVQFRTFCRNRNGVRNIRTVRTRRKD